MCILQVVGEPGCTAAVALQGTLTTEHQYCSPVAAGHPGHAYACCRTVAPFAGFFCYTVLCLQDLQAMKEAAFYPYVQVYLNCRGNMLTSTSLW